jgi:GTP-sensing pleiotropic transcriptional regulator CodY
MSVSTIEQSIRDLFQEGVSPRQTRQQMELHLASQDLSKSEREAILDLYERLETNPNWTPRNFTGSDRIRADQTWF